MSTGIYTAQSDTCTVTHTRGRGLLLFDVSFTRFTTWNVFVVFSPAATTALKKHPAFVDVLTQ